MHSSKRYISFLLIILVIMTIQSCKKAEVEKGVSWDMAQARKKAIADVKYILKLDIPESISQPINGTVFIDVEYRSTDERYLYIDFSETPDKIKSLAVNESPQKVFFVNEHIAIPTSLLWPGKINRIAIDFIGGDLSLNRNIDFLYTLFVPDRASTFFPCIDQPDIKASYAMELGIPTSWEAVSNEAHLPPFEENGKKIYQFNLTKPISTYQFAFAAGKFKQIRDSESNMSMYYRETDSIKVKTNAPEVFSLHRQSLAWMEEYTNISYPFIKLDFALIPDFQYGGMEHPGSIFYKESSLLLEPGATVNQKLRRANLIAHEVAHMWFGNLVTMKWFNDVWLKEVFANFMASKIVNPQFPEINHELRFLMDHYPAAYEIDRSEGTHPIQQELGNLKDAGTLYGAIIYQKAPIMMRNLETLVGEENFRRGLNKYLVKYNYSNATWDDLLLTLALETDKNLAVWNNSWIKGKGMPLISHSFEQVLRVKAENSNIERIWPQTFQYEIVADDQHQIVDLEIEDIKGDTISLLPIKGIVNPNFNGRGYGYFKTDESGRRFMLASVNKYDNPVTRAAIWLNLWEYVLNGELGVDGTLDAMVSTLQTETNPLVLEYLANRIEILFWQFSTPESKMKRSETLDNTLFELMALQKDNSLKRILFNCYRKVAMSEEGIANLEKFWKDEITLGLELSELDHVQLAYELAVRDVEGAPEILAQQVSQTINPDRKTAMQFIMPALSGDEATRDIFFESLKQPVNREHEVWVLEALTYLHHPLRADLSVKYIEPSLQMLGEIQLTGDIFFPKGWVDRTVSTYQSPKAADIVRRYLQANPDLSATLRNKLLQSADKLFRAEKILYGNKPGNV